MKLYITFAWLMRGKRHSLCIIVATLATKLFLVHNCTPCYPLLSLAHQCFCVTRAISLWHQTLSPPKTNEYHWKRKNEMWWLTWYFTKIKNLLAKHPLFRKKRIKINKEKMRSVFLREKKREEKKKGEWKSWHWGFRWKLVYSSHHVKLQVRECL